MDIWCANRDDLMFLVGLGRETIDGFSKDQRRDFTASAKDVFGRLGRDLETARAGLGEIFTEQPANRKTIERVFLGWRDMGVNAPSATAVTFVLMELDPSLTPEERRINIATAVNADVPNRNGYHNNDHNREVTVLYALFDGHLRKLYWPLAHDKGHDGLAGNKTADGVFVPARLERCAIGQSVPLWVHFGMSVDDMFMVNDAIITTDCSAGYAKTGHISPKSALGEITKSRMQPDGTIGAVDLTRLDTSKWHPAVADALIRVARAPSDDLQNMVALKYADIGGSALSLRMAAENILLLAREAPETYGEKPSANGLSFFFDNIICNFDDCPPAAAIINCPVGVDPEFRVAKAILNPSNYGPDDIRRGAIARPRPRVQ